MTASDVDIEQVVQEVIRRLRARQTPEELGKRQSQRADTAPDVLSQLEIDHPVVSIASIDGRLEGVRRLIIPRGAVLTPSVRDELRRRQIEVAFQNGLSKNHATQPSALLVGWQTTYDVSSLLHAVEDEGFRVITIACADRLEPVLHMVARSNFGEGQLAVVLTDQPSLALCLANRLPWIRAAWAVDQQSVDDAVRAIVPNLLLIEPVRQAAAPMTTMVQTFLRAGGGPCPDRLKAVFDQHGRPSLQVTGMVRK